MNLARSPLDLNGSMGFLVALFGSFGQAPSITNLRQNSLVETGFLIGTAPDAGSTVQISIDGGAWQSATGAASWTFKLPAGSGGWHFHSRHTISVRAQDSNGRSSLSQTISVIKGNNKDVNGDGYSDQVVGGSGYNSSQGRLYLFLSRGATGLGAAAALSASSIITGEAGTTGFGISVLLADVNGDGYSDLIAGATGYNTNQGRVYVFHSAGSGGIAATAATSANTIITGEGANNTFGTSIAAGDANGDGYDDLGVGGIAYNASQGRYYVFHSAGPSGITITAAASASTILTGEGASNAFGVGGAFGDINGDGFADLAVGANGYNANQGRAYVFLSSASGIASVGAAAASTILTGEATGNNFGLPMGMADANGDGFDDVATSGGYYGTFQGRVYVFHSTGSGIPSVGAIAAQSIIDGEFVNNILGVSMTFSDVNADGYADVGALGVLVGGTSSKAYVVLSRGSTGIPTIGAASSNNVITNLEGISNNWGKAISFSDLNGDGYPDLIAGSLYANTSAGRVRVFNSSLGVFSATDASQNNCQIDGEAASSFGVSLTN